MSVVTAISELLDLANEIQRTALAWVGNPAIDGKVREERRALRRHLGRRLRERIDVALRSRCPAVISISEMLEALNSFAAAVEGLLNWECQWALTPEGIQSIRDAKRRAVQPPIWPDNPEMRPYHPSNGASLTAYTRAETPFLERVSFVKDLRTMLEANL